MGIKDKLDLPEAEAWRPAPGDQVIGRVVSIDERTGDYEPYPCITIHTSDDTLVAVHGFHTVLKNELSKFAPQEGDEIGISYRGLKKSGAGREFENYRVVVERSDGSPAAATDWSAHAASAKADLDAGDDQEPF
jgi:hypothetical protein